MSLTESDYQTAKGKNKILIPIVIAAVSVLLIGGLIYLRTGATGKCDPPRQPRMGQIYQLDQS